MDQSNKEQEYVNLLKTKRQGSTDSAKHGVDAGVHNLAHTMSPGRQVKTALDHFEYLELEQSEEGSSIAAFR